MKCTLTSLRVESMTRIYGTLMSLCKLLSLITLLTCNYIFFYFLLPSLPLYLLFHQLLPECFLDIHRHCHWENIGCRNIARKIAWYKPKPTNELMLDKFVCFFKTRKQMGPFKVERNLMKKREYYLQ